MKELDPGIWDIAASDKVTPYFRSFVNTSMYSGKNKYFGCTKFHDHLTNILKNEIEATNAVDERNSALVGIHGIGKSSTVVYFVLSCINNGNQPVHYIDMDTVEDETDLCKVTEYLSSMQKQHTLIIDHVTLFNRSIVHKIEKQALGVVAKVLLIETGFSASARRHDAEFYFNNKWQLNRREFKTIWIESLKKMKYSLENQDTFIDDLYNYCTDKFILTPRLLQRVRNYFVRDGNLYDQSLQCGKDVEYFMMRYTLSLVSDITQFKLEYNRAVNSEKMTNEKQLCCEFSLHTKLLLHQMRENHETILTLEQGNLYKIAINMFNCENGRVTDNDLEKDIRFAELGLEKGDRYITITHLMPKLSDHWKEVFPFKIYDIIDNKFGIDASSLLKICFESGGVRKEFGRELVTLQYQMKFLIHPTIVQETNCNIFQGASCKFTLHQCDTMQVTTVASLTYRQPSLSDIENITVSTGYRGHDKNVAKMAYYIKKEIDNNSDISLLVYPAVSNFKGIDYILYTESHYWSQSNETPKRKKTKMSKLYALYLIQVATGATHTGVTIGEALNTFKNIIKDVPIHVVIFITRKEKDKYTLSGNMSFENVSVINLAHLSLAGWLKKSKLLYEVIKMIRES